MTYDPVESEWLFHVNIRLRPAPLDLYYVKYNRTLSGRNVHQK